MDAELHAGGSIQVSLFLAAERAQAVHSSWLSRSLARTE